METGIAIRGLRDGGMPPEQLREAIQQLRAQTAKRVESALDDSQKTAYRLLQAEQEAGSGQRGRVWIVGPDGKPTAVNVVAGISDGTATEIVRGELAVGAQVIVGIASAAAPR